MNLGKSLTDNVKSWGVLAIVIVVVSVILLKFKGVTGVTSDLNTTIDTFVSGLSEPKNWLIIAIISIVGFGILRYFSSQKTD